jgi:hypothetical protein
MCEDTTLFSWFTRLSTNFPLHPEKHINYCVTRLESGVKKKDPSLEGSFHDCGSLVLLDDRQLSAESDLVVAQHIEVRTAREVRCIDLYRALTHRVLA